MNEHTPWEIMPKRTFKNDPPESYEVVDSRHCHIADVWSGGSNAHLISAAPELLEVCKQWVKYFDALDDRMEPDDPIVAARRKYHGPRVELTRAAIAKATPPASPAEGAVK
jgi:hypothetical protein